MVGQARIYYAAALALVASIGTGCSNRPPSPTAAMPQQTLQPHVRSACDEPMVPGQVRCLALIRTDVGGRPARPAYASLIARTTASPLPQQTSAPDVRGYGPLELRDAYSLRTLATSRGRGQTVAIVDAFDDPNAEADLGVYRSYYGLGACTTASGCFRKVDQDGGANYPGANAGWADEISLDLDMVSAICPNCKILLVEARTDSDDTGIDAAENTAVRLGANVVSNSYGGPPVLAADPAFDHPGVVIVASAGDNGYQELQPASYPGVVSVGGTTLTYTAANNVGFTETVWHLSGGACSSLVPKPKWQTDAQVCATRSSNDISAVADPETGVAVYDNYNAHGWQELGGTSAACPIVAAVFALAGNEGKEPGSEQIWLDAGQHTNHIHIGGNEDDQCSTSPRSDAGPGDYSGPAGGGSPKGVGAF